MAVSTRFYAGGASRARTAILVERKADRVPPGRLYWEAPMNSRQTPPGGNKPVAKPIVGKPLGGKPLSAKPRDQQEKSKPNKTIAEATGAPKREDAMPAAATHARAIGSAEAQHRHMVSAAFESIERSFKAAGLGTVAVNRKLLDMARANVASGFDLARDLAGAKSPLEAARVQMAFFDERMKALAAQAQELRALHAELVTTASAPLREHVKRH
jgi:hypothetical protein